ASWDHNITVQENIRSPLGTIIYVAKQDGMIINLREFSSSKDKTKARWTIDIINNEQVSNLQGKSKKPIEIKFR
ncbi:hemagglutinin, partial [Klebsiella sp. K796]|uniref:hemagglutinin n=1 Tax=Klebsiella sp. K796 TaxID=3369403 RepID=UPI003C2F3BE2